MCFYICHIVRLQMATLSHCQSSQALSHFGFEEASCHIVSYKLEGAIGQGARKHQETELSGRQPSRNGALLTTPSLVVDPSPAKLQMRPQPQLTSGLQLCDILSGRSRGVVPGLLTHRNEKTILGCCRKP